MSIIHPSRAGRTTGGLLLAHLVFALMLPFILIDRVRQTSGLLENAAAHSGELRTAILMLVAGSSLAIAIAVSAWPVLRRYSPAAGLWLLTIATAAFALQVVDSGALLSLLSLRQEYAKAGAARTDLLQGLGLLATIARRWTHYSYLLVAVSWIVLFSGVLIRFRLVPRALAAFVLVGALLQITGVTLRVMLGYAPDTRFAMPLAPAYVALALWFIVKGFSDAPATIEERRAA
jgi:hypothetical protein